MNAKSIFMSKTMWANIGIGIIVVFWQNVQPYLHLTGEQAAGVAAIANMALRMVTTQPVAINPK